MLVSKSVPTRGDLSIDDLSYVSADSCGARAQQTMAAGPKHRVAAMWTDGSRSCTINGTLGNPKKDREEGRVATTIRRLVQESFVV